MTKAFTLNDNCHNTTCEQMRNEYFSLKFQKKQ